MICGTCMLTLSTVAQPFQADEEAIKGWGWGWEGGWGGEAEQEWVNDI